MPVYEYECGKCGVFETSQRIVDPALTKCPTCRRKVRRLISNTSFQLKGSGWYVTDYPRGGKKDGDGDGKAAAPSESSGESKSDAKSDPKSDTKKSKAKSESKSASKASPGSSAATS
jgi:putative FmdB family regulatory protein